MSVSEREAGDSVAPADAPPVFNLCGPLPSGTTVLEASAGTGKTYTVAGLATRYLAEGHARMDELMLVTFGRAATAELRDRVRQRLNEVTVALVTPDVARGSEDDLVRLLADVPDDEVQRRYSRLAAAVADFDAATIATTHGFCHQMLAGLGIAADLDADVTFAETTDDLVLDVAIDLYVADYGRSDSLLPPEGFGFRAAATTANRAVGDPSARLEPHDAEPDSEPRVRYDFADRARSEVSARKRAMRVMDYNDLLTHLREALTHPDTGEAARQRIRSRYKIVMVDEFQDTDPVQWDILRHAFHGHRTLILVGDPKQAIYAFRGADVVTYILAKQSAPSEQTLGKNYRSDWPLVKGLRRIFNHAALGDPRIRVYDVDAQHEEWSLRGSPVAAPVRVRRVPRGPFGVETTKTIKVDDARPFIARDVAGDIVALLSSNAELVEQSGKPRPVKASDVAVLVHRNEDGETVRDALAALDVPVVFTTTESVFKSSAADNWLALLSALEQPQRTGLARNAALTDFFGWSATDLATAGDAKQEVLGATLRRWAGILTDQGVAALMEAITSVGLPQRVLSRLDGERDLTDLRHIAQALHQARRDGYAGVSSLVQWLQHRMADAAKESDEELSRRLDSDADAVQVMTIWRAKGLEFPVVYAPFLWDRRMPQDREPLRLHDDATGERVLDVGAKSGPGHKERKKKHATEDAGETLRLAYVALTRARCQVVVHWSPGWFTAHAPLTRLIFGQPSECGVIPDKVDLPEESVARRRLQELADSSAGLLSAEVAGEPAGVPLAAPSGDTADLSVRQFDRTLDTMWRRASYSGITAGLHEASGALTATSEPERPGITDEPIDEPLADEPVEPVEGADALPSPMAGLRSGAGFGTLVHSVLERTDFSVPDLPAALEDACKAEDSERFAGTPPAELAAALVPSLQTPLGPLAGGRRLVDLAKSDRLDELEFEMPLVGGDAPTGTLRVADIATLVRRRLSPDDPLAAYADDLAVPLLAQRTLRGFLNGYIDAVLRVRDSDGTPRYLVVDYKTNWLGRSSGELMAYHYRPEALAQEMRRAHYPLQALLYCVALHRYLRWRQRDYDPGVHFGGVLYLFLRGMCGPDTPAVNGVPYGVFSWSPPSALITDLSDLLHRGEL